MSPAVEPSPPGLRERKKARTRTSIQQIALELFHTQGYAATTVEQICTAAEVSESTFFRYFPTKEAVVLTDEFDPLIIAAYRAQPARLGPVTALRAAINSVLGQLRGDEVEVLRARSLMILKVPELWGAVLVDLTRNVEMMSELIAERSARAVDDPRVRDLAGAIVGLMIAQLQSWADQPELDVAASIDESLAFLEAGLRIGRKRR